MQSKAALEILLFSGRENPVYALTSKALEKLLTYWEKAAITQKAVTLNNTLGYTGCNVITSKGVWHIYNGYITFFKNGIETTKIDYAKQIERFLLSLSTKEIRDLLKNDI